MTSSPHNKSSGKTLVKVFAVLVAIFALFVFALWRFLSVTGMNKESAVISATIALVGAFVGSIVSGVGLLLKHSIDTRTEDRLRLDTERNSILRQEAEDRQKLEACIRAVQLLATGAGQPSPEIQLTGVLFSLESLGQHVLTLSLAFNLLDRHAIKGAAAAEVIERALRALRDEKDEALRTRVVTNLASRADQLLTPTGIAVPESIMNEPSSFDADARAWIPALLGRVMAARRLTQWQGKYKPFAYAIIASLCTAWSGEVEPGIKNDIGTILSRLLDAFPGVSSLNYRRGVIDLTKIRSELQVLSAPTEAVGEVATILDTWMGKAPSSC